MRFMFAAAASVLIAACGSQGESPDFTASALETAAVGLSHSGSAYEAEVTFADSIPSCVAAAQSYAGEAQAFIDKMTVLAGQMDSKLSSMERATHGDVTCTANAMRQELTRHLATACGLPDMPGNRVEVELHVANMQLLANHMRMRAAEVGAFGPRGGTGMGGMGPGWAMPGGGVMSWDHHVPACLPGGPPPGGGVSDPPAGEPFTDPPLAPSVRNGEVVDVAVDARVGASEVEDGAATLLTYGGGFVAPVIRARRGDLLRIHFTNSLPAVASTNLLGHPRFVTNLHVHGLHVTPGTNPDGAAGDDVFRSVAAGGGSLDYEHDLSLQPAGSMGFYHPHMHGAVAEQIWGGMIGPIDVEDAPGSPLAGYETHLLVLKDVSLAGGTPTPYDSIVDYVMGKEGDRVMVNGQVNPVLPIRPGQVQRWRIYNASTARFYRLSLEGHPLQVVGTDGGLLDKPYPVPELLLAPAERIDVLVKAAPGAGTSRLLALPYDRGGMGMMGGGMGGMPGPGGTTSVQVTLLTVERSGAAATDTLPAVVNAAAKRIDLDVASLPRTRFVLGMMMGRGTINGVSFDEMADGTVSAYQHDSRVGTYELWEIVNQTGMDHPWHQHVNSAQVVAASGTDPAFSAYADLYTRVPGLKDTVIVPRGGSVTLLVPVLDHAGRTVFHCHIVEHEDIGMMGVWNIRP